MTESKPRWMQRFSPEDPQRIAEFRKKLNDLHWDLSDAKTSLEALFSAVDDLAEAEVKYYYRRRGTRAWISGICRSVAWIFGTIGLLLPLLAGTNDLFKDGAKYGYAFLVAAASFLAANSLFGGTEGHVRFVSVQLELEKLIVSSRVSWCEFLTMAGHSIDENAEEQLKLGFSLIQKYAESLYTASISETGMWGETLLAELMKFQNSISRKGAGVERD